MTSMIGNRGVAGPTGRVGNKIPSGYKLGQLQNFTPEQMKLFQQMFGQLGPESYLSRLAGGDQDMFNQMEAPAMRQFAGLQGNIASRFSGMGMGARRSSGFGNVMNQAGSDFAQDLAARRQEIQHSALRDLIGLSTQLLGQRPYEQIITEKQHRPSTGQMLLGAGATGLGTAAGAYLGGAPGAQIGYRAGASIGRSLGGY